MIHFACIALFAAIFAVTGCKTTQTAEESPTGLPVPFEFSFQSRRADNRATYYELSTDGSLGFGGGRDGRYAIARPIGKITHTQAAQLWAIVRDHKLLETEGESYVLKLDWKSVRYDVKIKAADASNSFTLADTAPTGVEAMEKKLFEIQGDLRYSELFRPIDEAVRKGDGSIKKKQ